MHCQVTCLWKEPDVADSYRAGVCLHGHTNHSKESLFFIPQYAARHPVTQWIVKFCEKKSLEETAIPLDFSRAYWTPALTPIAALQLEKRQIENRLDLDPLVSITDHDSITAPMLLRVIPEACRTPVSTEWSVRYRGSMFHFGIHNLPSADAESIIQVLNMFSANPVESDLPEVLEMLHDNPDILIVLNHPMWDMTGVGADVHLQNLAALCAQVGMFMHAMEMNGLRDWKENQFVMHYAEGWNVPVISGGDRHGCEAGACVNLTSAGSFTEFVHEVREDGRSHLLFMPQYQHPMGLRALQAFLDSVREYPDYPKEMRRWEQRVFHHDYAGNMRPICEMWQGVPGPLKAVLSIFQMAEHSRVRDFLHNAFARPHNEIEFLPAKRQEVV